MSRITRAVEFIEQIARMKTSAEIGNNPFDTYEDWVQTLNSLIVKARDIAGVDEDYSETKSFDKGGVPQ